MLRFKIICESLVIFGFVLSLANFIAAQKNGTADDTRIVGGTTTTIAEHPYIVQLLFDNQFICGGSILSKRWVLTAAHCIYGYGKQPKRFKVRGGATYLTGNNGVTRNVLKIIRTDNYNPNTLNMDAAMLKLKGSMTGKNIKPISLTQNGAPNGAFVRASGWGYTSENGNVSNRLRTVLVPKISNPTCRQRYAKQGEKITENMICASKTGKDSCSGDSGGPLTYEGRLVGIVSWGIGCARPNYPGVYANVVKIKPFINRVRRNN